MVWFEQIAQKKKCVKMRALTVAAVSVKEVIGKVTM